MNVVLASNLMLHLLAVLMEADPTMPIKLKVS
jgi:hypothetical protein